jgi:hypothetical protein
VGGHNDARRRWDEVGHAEVLAGRQADIPVTFSQSYRSAASIGRAHPDRPDEWLSRWATVTPGLPFATNRGQYRDTGAAKSSSPRSASSRATNAVMVLVTE